MEDFLNQLVVTTWIEIGAATIDDVVEQQHKSDKVLWDS